MEVSGALRCHAWPGGKVSWVKKLTGPRRNSQRPTRKDTQWSAKFGYFDLDPRREGGARGAHASPKGQKWILKNILFLWAMTAITSIVYLFWLSKHIEFFFNNKLMKFGHKVFMELNSITECNTLSLQLGPQIEKVLFRVLITCRWGQRNEMRWNFACNAGVNINPPPPPHPGTRWGLEENRGDLGPTSCPMGWGIGAV